MQYKCAKIPRQTSTVWLCGCVVKTVKEHGCVTCVNIHTHVNPTFFAQTKGVYTLYIIQRPYFLWRTIIFFSFVCAHFPCLVIMNIFLINKPVKGFLLLKSFTWCSNGSFKILFLPFVSRKRWLGGFWQGQLLPNLPARAQKSTVWVQLGYKTLQRLCCVVFNFRVTLPFLQNYHNWKTKFYT